MAQALLRTAGAVAFLAVTGCATPGRPGAQAPVYVNDTYDVAIAIFEPGHHLSDVVDPDNPEATEFGYPMTDCGNRTIACLSFAGIPMAVPRCDGRSRWTHAGTDFEVQDIDAREGATIIGTRDGVQDIVFRYERTRGVVEFTLRPSGPNAGSKYRLYSPTGLLAAPDACD